MQRIFKLVLILAILTLGATAAQAVPGYVTLFDSTYPNATSIGNCALCHVNPSGGGTRNSFGSAFEAAGDSFTSTVETAPSRCSGYTNLQLINLLITPGDGTTCPTTTPACTSYTYTVGACQSNNTAPVLTSVGAPAGCSGGASPATTQPCTYVPPVTACTGYTYTLGACQSNNTAPVLTSVGVPAGCSGGATPATTQPCTYVPPTCSAFTYSAWGACQSNGTQTRTVLTSTPTGCTGGTPVTSQACTYVPACTSFNYTLGACQSNNTAPVLTSVGVPAGCSGGASPATTQPCTYVPPVPAACTYTYSSWGSCQASDTQTRTVTSVTPAGCSGTPVTSQTCAYVPPDPPPSTGTISLPKGAMTFTYPAVASPEVNADPSQAKPIGIGSVATGGNTLDVSVNVGPFAGTVNISLRESVPAYSARNVYSMNSEDHMTSSSGSISIWKADVTGINQHVYGPISVSRLKKGLYTLTITATPSGSGNNEDDDVSSYYQWTTHFTVK